MKPYYFILFFIIILFSSLFISSCTSIQQTTEQEKEISQPDVNAQGNIVVQETGYKGKVLAGTEETKYLEFNKEDYEKALKEKEKIMLYFYANWCPICKVEQVSTFNAFNQIHDPNLIGFRINYRDSETDEFEEQLAKELGISYQHTKIILKNKERILKAPDSWNKERYLEELKKA